MNGQVVLLEQLPSRGFAYPDNIEIYVKPMTLREQIDMDRYGITQAEYFQTILNGVTISGNFNKNDLLHADVQFLDVVRRLYSFDTKDKIIIKDEPCMYPDCDNKFDFEFTMEQIEFTDFSKDIFGKHFIFGEGTDNPLEVTVSPLTVSEFIDMSKRIRNFTDRKNAVSNIFLEYCCTCIREVIGREFKNKQDRNSFLKGYLSELSSAADKKVAKAIEDETVIQIKPFKVLCENCGRETEVVVSPTSNFQQ